MKTTPQERRQERSISYLICAVLLALVTACGGGGSDRGAAPPPLQATTPNSVPVANAGADQEVKEGQVVVLDGSDSSDEDGDVIKYKWSQLSGPHVSLGSNIARHTAFKAPEVSEDTALRFQLIVNDGKVDSQPDTVEVMVVHVNKAPRANAGERQTAAEKSTVTLDGSASSDPDGDELTYNWAQISGTKVSLSGITAVQPTFTAPDLSTNENLVFRLTVDDGELSSANSVTVTILAVDDPPSADAGSDQLVKAGDVVTLDGSASTDPDSSTLTYSWTGPAHIALSNPNSPHPRFVASTNGNGSVAEINIFTLEVTDGSGNSSLDTVSIEIETKFLVELNSIVGDRAEDLLGTSIIRLPDLNGDGIAEFAVGASRYDGEGSHSGAVYIRNGADGNVMVKLEGEGPNHYFGHSLALLRDVNSDGFDELIIGATGAGENGQGRVYVYSSNLAHYHPESETDPLLVIIEDKTPGASGFGWSISSIPDVNHDGYDDVVIGAPFTSHSAGPYSPPVQSGRVYVFSGRPGGTRDNSLFFIDGESAGDEFGTSVATVGNLLGSHLRWHQLLIGAPGYGGVGTNSGKVYVYAAWPAFYEPRSHDQPLLYTLEGESAGDNYGYTIQVLPDIDGDHFPELVIGAPSLEPDDERNSAGAVYVHSGSGWTNNDLLFKLEGVATGDQFGGSIAVLDDINGDGFADISVTAFRYATNGDISSDVVGSLGVFSGNPTHNTGGQTRLYFWKGKQAAKSLGQVTSFVDVDGDGFNEILLAAPLFDTDSSNNAGKVYLLSVP